MAARKSTPEQNETKAAQTPRGSIWTYYRVRWTFLTRLCGSVPSDPKMIAAWIQARQPKTKPAGAKSIQEINEEVLESLEQGDQAPEFSVLQFQRHDGALVQRYGTIRAHLKDCARVLSAQYVGRLEGERAFSTRVVNAVYLDEHVYWVPILRPDGSPVRQAVGEFMMDKAVHVRGPRGEPLNALKCIEYIEPPTMMDFTLKVLGSIGGKNESVKEDDLRILMEYGGVHGYAGERSDGEGRYEFELERIDAPKRRAADSNG